MDNSPYYIPSKRMRRLSLLDAAVLLYHVWKAAGKEEVGFEDANNTLGDLTARFRKKVYVFENVLESCLWSCNLLNERGEWQDVRGRTFAEFAAHVCSPDRFNPTYNCIEKKGGEE